MSGLEALALACNVIQVAEFGCKVAGLCKTAHEQGQARPDLEKLGKSFDNAHEALEKSLVQDDILGELNQDDAALLELSQKCSATSKELQHELEKLNVKGPGGRWHHSLKAGSKALWSSGTLEKLQRTLSESQQVLQSRLLVDLRTRIDINAIKQENQFERLDKSFQNLLTQVASGEKALDHALNARRDDICQHLTQELETMKLELFDKDHHKRVLDSLFFPEMTARQEGISDSYRDTFQWIFEHDFDANEPSSVPGDDFMEWIEHGEDIYWISGKFGSGKSTLMRLICEDSRVSEALAKWSGTKSLVTTQFFLFMPSAQSLQKTVSGLLRAILYQILDRQPNLTPLAVPDGTSRIGTWTNKRLKTALTRILKECSTSVAFCMFVDGLDELDSDVTELLELLRSFSHMRNVKLCVSSRPEHILERHLSQYKKLRMQDLTYKDLKKYAEGKLWEYFRQQDYCDIGEDKISDLVRQLTSQAHGVFVWMKLAVDSILRGIMYGDSYDLLQARVEELPPDIDKLYEHMLSKIDHVHKARVARYIRARMAHGSTVAHPDGSESAPLHEIFILSVLTLALLDLDSDKDNEMMFHDTPDEIELEKHCLKAQQGILAQCVGFLELPNIHRGVAEIHAKREEIKSGSCLARFDSERCSVEFAHRTASDFFKTHGEVLVGMGRDLPQTWTPDEALARAMIRRMEVLPWMFDLLQAGLLYEPVQCLCYVYSAEIAQERAFPDVISALDDVAQSIASHPNMAETKDSTWNHFVPSFAIYYISDMGINEVCAIFNLYHFIKHTLQNNQVDRDALLICAFLTAGPLGYLPLHFKLVKLLLQEGSNPNVPFIAKSATHFRHGQLFQKSGYTAWMESLDHANDENDVDGEKAIQCTLDMMRDFVLHGADPNAVSESERVPIRFVVSQQIGAYFLSSVFVSVTLSPLAILNDLFPTRLSGFPDYSKYIQYTGKVGDQKGKAKRILRTINQDKRSPISSIDHSEYLTEARESCDCLKRLLKTRGARQFHLFTKVEIHYNSKDGDQNMRQVLGNTEGLTLGEALTACLAASRADTMIVKEDFEEVGGQAMKPIGEFLQEVIKRFASQMNEGVATSIIRTTDRKESTDEEE